MNILAFDIGTSAIKTSLVSFSGQLIDSDSCSYGINSVNKNWAEQDPDEWWRGAQVSCRKLFERNPGLKKDIAVIGVCGHMMGCLPVDKKGAALRPAMIHSDTRAALETEDIANMAGREALYQRSGNILCAQSPISKILWLKRNEPGIYARTARFLQSKDYLVSRLTGNINVTDFSDASHAQLIDIHKKAYLTDIFTDLSLEADKFPDILKGTDVAGKTTEAAARELDIPSGIPVIAGGGDGACANVGAGISAERGEVYCCMGTTAWVSYNSAGPVIDSKARIFDIMSLDGCSFGVFGTMQAAGKSVQWAQQLFGFESGAAFDAEAALSKEGSGGLIFLPYLEGERSPIFDANARGLFFNISSAHQRADFARSVLEGVAFALNSILEVYREQREISEVRVIGGGANSGIWMSILADVFNADILTPRENSSSITSLGVALAAGVGIGVYKDLAAASAVIQVARKNSPKKENTGLYMRAFEKYMRLYPQLKTLFTEA